MGAVAGGAPALSLQSRKGFPGGCAAFGSPITGSDRKESLCLYFVTLLDPAACAGTGLQWSPDSCSGTSWKG